MALASALGRIVHAQSGNQTTDRAYDSLSRCVQEVESGKTVTYTYDDVGNATGVGYPSGYSTSRVFDPLDRVLSVPAGPSGLLAAYTYQGPSARKSKSLANGLAATAGLDTADRLTSEAFGAAFGQILTWTSRSLKGSLNRSDLANGNGAQFSYDASGRLSQRQLLAAPPPNQPPPVEDSISFQYDGADNLIGQADPGQATESRALPDDGRGRNRPRSINGTSLTWDGNGNLVGKGARTFAYDFRNRLVQVTDPTAGVTRFEYDAFNRRITKTSGGTAVQTVWEGWRPIEDYAGSRLRQRRTYGADLDEMVYLESNLDGASKFSLFPLYDATGNLDLVTDPAGNPVERYSYDPYGVQQIRVGQAAPRVQQARVVGNALWVELSKAVHPSALADALAAGTLTLVDETTKQPIGGVAVSQPVLTGRQARRRLVLTVSGPPPVGHRVTVTLPPQALRDIFLKHPDRPYKLTFTWPARDAVLDEQTRPAVHRVGVRNGVLEVQLTHEPDLSSARAAIRLDGQLVDWTLAEDHYTLRSTAEVPAGRHALIVGTQLSNVGGTPLAAALSRSFTVGAQDTLVAFEAPDDEVITTSSVGNTFGFQGLPQDPETGFVYFRNRYYDPEMGHFISPDPLGFVDGPSQYAFEGDDPANGSDPLGLEVLTPSERHGIQAKRNKEYEQETEAILSAPPSISAQPAGNAESGALWYALDFMTFGFFSDPNANYAPLDPSGGRALYTIPGFLRDASSNLGAFRQKYRYEAGAVDIFTGWKSPNRVVRLVAVGVAVAGLIANSPAPQEGNIAPHKSQPSPRDPLQSHHIIKNDWAIANIQHYSERDAPTILLRKGNQGQHSAITTAQNARRDERIAKGRGKWSTTFAEELENAARDLRRAGFSEEKILEALQEAERYFGPLIK